MDNPVTLAYYKPPFTIHMDWKLMVLISPNKKFFVYCLISSLIHEFTHLLQFFIVAHCDIKYYNTLRYHKMTEHQAYFISHCLIGKIMHVETNYPHILKVSWKELEQINWKP